MKNIYVSWHINSHGIGFTKNTLAAFYSNKISINDPWIDTLLKQKEMENAFSRKDGFLFDEVHYLTVPTKVIEKEFTYRGNEKQLGLEREDDGGVLELKKVWTDLLKLDGSLEDLFEYAKSTYPKHYKKIEKQIWRFIHYFPLEDQLNWFQTKSNAANQYKGRFKEHLIVGLDDLRDIKGVAEAVEKKIREITFKKKNANYFVNLSAGFGEAMVVWYTLFEAGRLPEKTRFFRIRDDKSTTKHTKRFRDFYVKECPTNIVSSIQQQFEPFKRPTSTSRILVNKLMENYLKSGFAILLLGERGIGKSRLAAQYADDQSKFKAANCASFDDDSKAEAELFGTKKGAFTGAVEKKGLFLEAEKGILFLDEIHHLSKRVQAKLMRALSTDANNEFSIRRLGSEKEEKVKCTVVLASNLSIQQLKGQLLPDFYDRISQLVIELPPLRDTPQDRIEDWENIWNQMKFDPDVPESIPLQKWLKTLDLPGNYRDLQKIAIAYYTFTTFDDETKKMLPGKSKTALAFAQSQYAAYHAIDLQDLTTEFSIERTTKVQVHEFKKRFAHWIFERFGSFAKAIEHYNALGDTITKATLYSWRKED